MISRRASWPVTQLEQGQHTIENQYARSVQACGNTHAAALIDDVYEVCDRDWRGLGVVNGGGLRLRETWRAFDAESTSFAEQSPSDAALRCQAGAVLAGRLKPCDCPEFGRSCTPEQPLGAPMVSSEGACAAYFHYRPTTVLASRT